MMQLVFIGNTRFTKVARVLELAVAALLHNFNKRLIIFYLNATSDAGQNVGYSGWSEAEPGKGDEHTVV